MVKHSGDSVIEVWRTDYINNPNERYDEDKNARIIQIEPGSTDCEYIVEVVRK